MPINNFVEKEEDVTDQGSQLVVVLPIMFLLLIKFRIQSLANDADTINYTKYLSKNTRVCQSSLKYLTDYTRECSRSQPIYSTKSIHPNFAKGHHSFN